METVDNLYRFAFNISYETFKNIFFHNYPEHLVIKKYVNVVVKMLNFLPGHEGNDKK